MWWFKASLQWETGKLFQFAQSLPTIYFKIVSSVKSIHEVRSTGEGIVCIYVSWDDISLVLLLISFYNFSLLKYFLFLFLFLDLKQSNLLIIMAFLFLKLAGL